MSEFNVEKKEQEVLSEDARTFRDLLNKADKIDSKCVDFEVNSKQLILDRDSLILGLPTLVNNEYTGYDLTRHSFSQLCGKLEIPVRYMKKCIKEGYNHLVADNVNKWLENSNKDFLVRTHNDYVRGLLTPRYSIMDTPEILDVLQDTVGINNLKVKSHFLSPERFHLRMIEDKMLNIVGEDLFAGISIDSSDVGRSNLIVSFFIYKQVCTNGLIVSKGGGVIFQQKHIGISKDEFKMGLKENLNRIPVIKSSIINGIEASRNIRIHGELNKTGNFMNDPWVIDLVEKTNASEQIISNVIDIMNEKYQKSKWGFINAITEVAQQYTLDRRLQLEEYAGSLLVA